MVAGVLDPMMAAFVTSGLAWAGAGAVSIPILIHLLARRRFRRIRWAAMDFLVDAERRNRRRVRMEEWILLALRCLAMLLAGWLVARPFVTPSGIASALGGARRIERVFVLDDSFSMAYETPQGQLFDRAKSGIRRMIEWIRRETPDDTVTLVRMSAPSKPVAAGASLDDSGVEELLARLEGQSVSHRPIDPPMVFEGIAEALQRDGGIVNAAVYLFSDFQRKDWGIRTSDAGDAKASESVAAPLAAWSAGDRALRLVFVNIGEPNAANAAVTAVSIAGGQLVAGAEGNVRAAVANYSDRALGNLELKISVDNRAQDSKTIPTLGERQSATCDLEAEFPRPGDESVRIDIARDALTVDDSRFTVAEVVSAVRLLLVNGEPSADGYDDEVALLETALRPEGEVFSGYEVVVVDEAGLEDVSLPSFHVVVLANVYRVAEPTVERLERFIRQGGGLVVFLGDQVDAESYNSALYRGGEGVLPAEIGPVVRAPDAAHLTVVERLHPALRAVGREDDPLGLGQVRFAEFMACKPIGAEKTEGEPTDSGPAPTRTAKVVVRFDDPEAHPAVIEGDFGLGRVVVFTSSADKEWNDWPDHPTYLPVVAELVRHVSRRSDTGVEQLVGAVIDVPVDPGVFAEEAVVRTPAYPSEPEVTVTATTSPDGRGLVARWEHTETPGVYQFALPRREGGETVHLVAVNVDSRESDLAMAGETELRRAMGGVAFEYIQGSDRLEEAAGETRIELWRIVLLAAATVLLTEQFLAWRWGRRR